MTENKCKHEWRMRFYNGNFEDYFCVKCLAEARINVRGERRILTIKEVENEQ